MKLATIERISEVINHPNADKLTIYKMHGLAWRVISAVKLDVGDLVCYIHTDTVAPEKPEFEFLRKNKFRIKCIKLRGEYSNGLILPLVEVIGMLPKEYYEIHPNEMLGMDIGEQIGVTKYEKPVAYQSGDADGAFPTHIISKTDEERIENFPEAIEHFRGKDVYVSLKHDGSSTTVINHIEEGFVVCSRNLKIKESKDSKYWQPVFKYNLKENLPVGYGIQFELVGEGIQNNPEGIKGVDARVFHVWELETRRLLDYRDALLFCKKLDIPMVDTYYVGEFKWDSVEDMIEEAKNARYQNGAVAEGLVWKLAINEYSDNLQKVLSVKTINYDYKD